MGKILSDLPKQSPSAKKQFSEFWQAYPRKTAKAGAEAKFLKLVKAGKVSGDDLTAGAKRYAAEVAKRGPTQDGRIAICHPTTWLNNGRWEDEIDTGPGGAGAASPTAGFSPEMRVDYERRLAEAKQRRAEKKARLANGGNAA